jgi:hypothetical protein
MRGIRRQTAREVPLLAWLVCLPFLLPPSACADAEDLCAKVLLGFPARRTDWLRDVLRQVKEATAKSLISPESAEKLGLWTRGPGCGIPLAHGRVTGLQ